MSTKSYHEPAVAVNNEASEGAVEIQVVAYEVKRTPRAIIKIPISINGVAVKPECTDPALVHDAFLRFINGRCDEDPRVRDLVNGILAKVRSENPGVAH